MSLSSWRVCITEMRVSRPPDCGVPEGVERSFFPDDPFTGSPFLLSPLFEYDVDLNSYFRSPSFVTMSLISQQGYARNIAAFLSFLTSARSGSSWRDANEDDHVAYLVWRRRDVFGPRVSGATWNREVAAVNNFYRWAVRKGFVAASPVPHHAPSGRSRTPSRIDHHVSSPTTYSRDVNRDNIEWIPQASYRQWRDAGMKGMTADGLPRPAFRGRWAARNAAFCDLMVRTGLRLAEQSALTVFDLPTEPRPVSYQRFRLPLSIAKGSSTRWVYVPESIVRELINYRDIDRRQIIDDARARGQYDKIVRPLVIENPARPVAVDYTSAGVKVSVKLSNLDHADRRRLYIAGDLGLEPASFWLTERGMPVSLSRWKGLFHEANVRCADVGVPLRVHPHMLRHTFAVVTLEQLQRGHIAALSEQTSEQRGHYTRVFGDPLDWVRRRMGHRSVTTTMIYLHTLAELEMETRMALVPDDWGELPAPWTPLAETADFSQ
ncbi:site-specific recombinase XerD [Rhodococcus sp. 27YEA15]|uniref:tyrosine-type recombinase/integrase n=1 Tax=Rhodococcus sp. 27YEA15 TaxID=3156259 RepID=UPI003C7D9C8F